jgi:hypothetical protein
VKSVTSLFPGHAWKLCLGRTAVVIARGRNTLEVVKQTENQSGRIGVGGWSRRCNGRVLYQFPQAIWVTPHPQKNELVTNLAENTPFRHALLSVTLVYRRSGTDPRISLGTSTAALIATGWSEPVPGRVYPAVDQRLSRRTRQSDYTSKAASLTDTYAGILAAVRSFEILPRRCLAHH